MVNIYELLNRIIVNKRYSLSPNLFIEADRIELSEEERSIFDLLKNIVSLGTKIHNDGIEFHPMFVSVCTTGFAVIHPKEMDSMVLALILQSEFVLKQIKKYAMGISYPVIDEKDFMEIYLPLKKTDYTKYNGVTDRIKQLENELCSLRAEFKKSISLELLDI